MMRPQALAIALLLAALAGPSTAFDLLVETLAPAPRFIDRSLISADGEPVRFIEDVVAGEGGLLVSFTFTGCLQQCPVSDKIVDRIAELAEADGRADLRFVTLTINPLDDTPERLRAKRADEDHHPARLFLTGNAADVCTVVEGLGMRCGGGQDHLVSFIIVGDGGRSALRVDDLQGPERLYAVLAGFP